MAFSWGGGKRWFPAVLCESAVYCGCAQVSASRQRLSGAPGSSEASRLPLQRGVYAACLCALQALKRKPDLFLCSNLDVKAVFQCGEYHGHGHVLQVALRRNQPAPPEEPGTDQPGAGDQRADLGWCAVFLAVNLSDFLPAGVLSLKFPEAPTVKASCGFFVSNTCCLKMQLGQITSSRHYKSNHAQWRIWHTDSLIV